MTRSYSRESIPVLLPSQLSDELGSSRAGVKCLLLGYRNANILLWPYTTLPQLRPVSRLASWVLTDRERQKLTTGESDDTAAGEAGESRPAVVLTTPAPLAPQVIDTPIEHEYPSPPLAVAPASTVEQSEVTAIAADDASTLAALEDLIGDASATMPPPDATAPAKKRRIVRKKFTDVERESD